MKVPPETLNHQSPSTVPEDSRFPSTNVSYWILAALVCYAIAREIMAAAARPLWFDELLTLAVSSQPRLVDIFAALHHAVDGQAPLFYLFERVALKLISNPHIALRLPGVLGFACTLLCTFVLVRKRNSPPVALLCSLLLLVTSLFHAYAIDARAYSLLVACIAFAIVCYEQLPGLRWALLLAVSLALAESVHYYAIFAMAAFALAEIAFWGSTRKFRWQVWAALAFGASPLLIWWPILSAIRTYYGSHLWMRYSLNSVPQTYGSFFLTGAAFGSSIVAVSVAGVIGAQKKQSAVYASESTARDLAFAVLILALISLPLLMTVATTLAHAGMVDRYAIASILGIVLAMGSVLSLANRDVVLVFAIFVFTSLALHEYAFWRTSGTRWISTSPTASTEHFMDKAGRPDLPVVVSDGLIYLQLVYYASPAYAQRFAYLADEAKAVTYLGHDSVEKGLLALRPYARINVQDFTDFTSTHRDFHLYLRESTEGFNWVEHALDGNASLQLEEMEGNQRLYLVHMNTPQPAQKQN